MMRARFYSVFGLLPDWAYFSLTKNGRELGKQIKILHTFTKKVKFNHLSLLYVVGLLVHNICFEGAA